MNSHHHGSFGAVASGHPVTSEVALQILSDGGNAFDAAIGASVMACGAEPILASLGGGGFFVGQRAGESPVCLDFFTQSPSQPINKEAEIDKVSVNFKNASQDFYIGMATTAVPGMVRGLFEMHQRLGYMPLKTILAYPQSFIRNGISVSHLQAAVFQLVKPIYLHTSAARTIFQSENAPTADVLNENEMILNDALANTIDGLAQEGEQLFYQGEIAERMLRLMKEHHGALCRADLQNYQTVWRQPLQFDLNTSEKHHQIYTNPLPAVGGLYIKSLLQGYFKVFGENSARQPDDFAHFKQLAGQLKNLYNFTGTANELSLDDNEYQSLKAILEERRHAHKGTTHISVIDKNRHVASVTISNGEGNGYIIPNTGIMLNNMLGECDVNPYAPNGWLVNRRLSSMMSPTIVIEEDKLHTDYPVISLGSGGSNRIPSVIAQSLIQYLIKRKNVRESILSPRVHYQNQIFLESEKNSDNTSLVGALLNSLDEEVNLFENIDFYFGGVNAASFHHKKTSNAFEAYSDPRRS